MTYLEAKDKKNKIGDVYTEKKCNYKVLIAPIENENKFITDSLTTMVNDEKCKLYTNSDDFTLIGLYDDGANILIKRVFKV